MRPRISGRWASQRGRRGRWLAMLFAVGLVAVLRPRFLPSRPRLLKKESKSYERRDFLRKIEREVQSEWSRRGSFKAAKKLDSRGKPMPKYFVTFPYPYMNGRLHIGHAFSLSKAEFSARFQRLLGKNVLFAFGFHCTGMPIQAAANRLKAEIEKYGCPPRFTEDAKSQWEILRQMKINESEIPRFVNASHWLEVFPKMGLKDLESFGGAVDYRRSFITTDKNPFYDSFIKWQFNTLRKNGRIKFGKRPDIYSTLDQQICLDHDRSTGEGVQPCKRFVLKLRIEKEKVTKEWETDGSVYLLATIQRPETFYGVTAAMVSPKLSYNLYDIGQDVWIMTERAALGLSYQGFDLKCRTGINVSGNALVGLMARLPKNSSSAAVPIILSDRPDLNAGCGTGIAACVPSDSIEDYLALQNARQSNKSFSSFENANLTGIVERSETANDRPPRYIDAGIICSELKLKSFQNVNKLRMAKERIATIAQKQGVLMARNSGPYYNRSVVEIADAIESDLLSTGEGLNFYEPAEEVRSRTGDRCIVALCDQWYIAYGDKDWKKRVKDFVNGNQFEDYKVNKNMDSESQFSISTEWLQEWACTRKFGLGTKLPWDPTWVIDSLSDSTIYMAYYTIAHYLHGEGNLDGRGPNINQNEILESFWDEDPAKKKRNDNEELEYLDERIKAMMSQYDKTEAEPAAKQIVPPSMMCHGFWEFILKRSGPMPLSEQDAPLQALIGMKEEFEYWYPVDLRVSGKDLVRNHLVMCLYNHAEIWRENPKIWPKSMKTNGYLLLNSEKMSKSTGNFMLLSEAIEKFGADAVRLALADAGDASEDDANFRLDTADKAISRLFNFIQSAHELRQAIEMGHVRAPSEYTSNMDKFLGQVKHPFQLDPTDLEPYEKMVLNEASRLLNGAKRAYQLLNFRESLHLCLYEMDILRDGYLNWCKLTNKAPQRALITRLYEWQCIALSPICPHTCECIWDILQRQIFKTRPTLLAEGASWPLTPTVDKILEQEYTFLKKAMISFREQLDFGRKGAKNARDNNGIRVAKIEIVNSPDALRRLVIEMLRQILATKMNGGGMGKSKEAIDTLKTQVLSDENLRPKANEILQIAAHICNRLDSGDSLAFMERLPFCQRSVLEANKIYILRSLNLTDFEVVEISNKPDGLEALHKIRSVKNRKGRRVASMGNPMIQLLQH